MERLESLIESLTIEGSHKALKTPFRDITNLQQMQYGILLKNVQKAEQGDKAAIRTLITWMNNVEKKKELEPLFQRVINTMIELGGNFAWLKKAIATEKVKNKNNPFATSNLSEYYEYFLKNLKAEMEKEGIEFEPAEISQDYLLDLMRKAEAGDKKAADEWVKSAADPEMENLGARLEAMSVFTDEFIVKNGRTPTLIWMMKAAFDHRYQIPVQSKAQEYYNAYRRSCPLPSSSEEELKPGNSNKRKR